MKTFYETFPPMVVFRNEIITGKEEREDIHVSVSVSLYRIGREHLT